MIKELTRQEVAKKLSEYGCFEGYVRDGSNDEWEKELITGVDLDEITDTAIYTKYSGYCLCAIEVPGEYEPYPDDVCPDLKCGDVIINKADNIKHLVSAIDERNLNTKHIRIDEGWIIDNEALFNCYVKSDGTPIGRLKGE